RTERPEHLGPSRRIRATRHRVAVRLWSRMARSSSTDLRLAVSARRKHSDTPARPVDPGLGFVVDPQPDDETCGPACLHGIYRHYGDDVPLAKVAAELHRLDSGGTRDVFFPKHPLNSGEKSTARTN